MSSDDQSESDGIPSSERTDSKPKKIVNPVFTENMRTYTQISQTLTSLHAQQVYFGGFYGHNDPISPMTRNVRKGHQRGGSMYKSETFQSQMMNSQQQSQIMIKEDKAPSGGGVIQLKRMQRLRQLLAER